MSTREEKNRDIQKEIENDELRKKRKKIIIFFFKIIIIIVVLFTSFYLYTKYISTNGLIVKEQRIVSNKLPENFNSTKIIQISDFHYGSTVYLEDIKSIVKKINIRKPDIIVFTGDLIDKSYNIKSIESEELITELSKISATISKYSVSGDEDDDDTNTILKQSGFINLNNTYDLIYNNENTPILITGLSSIKNKRDIDKAFSYYQDSNNNKDIYNILLMHEADSLDEILNTYNVDLALAGSSLNGQICLTSDLCLIKKDGSKKYFKEYYKVNNTKLYISSGIGTGSPEFRFMARPSINFFRLALK